MIEAEVGSILVGGERCPDRCSQKLRQKFEVRSGLGNPRTMKRWSRSPRGCSFQHLLFADTTAGLLGINCSGTYCITLHINNNDEGVEVFSGPKSDPLR